MSDQISYTDSLASIDANYRLNIDNVDKGKEAPNMEPNKIIRLSDIGKVSKEDNSDTNGDELSPGTFNVGTLDEAVVDNNLTGGNLEGEEFNTAIEAYDNLNIRNYEDSNIAEDGISNLDRIYEFSKNLPDINEDNFYAIGIATDVLRVNLGISNPIVSKEDYSELGNIKTKQLVLESIKDTIKNGFKRIVEFIKKIWDNLVTAIKSIFSKVYDFIKTKANSLKKKNDEAPNVAKELGDNSKYEVLTKEIVRAFGKSNRVSTNDVLSTVDDQLKIRSFLNDINTNLVLSIMTLVHETKEINDYKDFFENTLLGKIVNKLVNLDFVYNSKLDKPSSTITKIMFKANPVEADNPLVVPGDRNNINAIISAVLESNSLVKEMYDRINKLNKDKDRVLDRLTINLDKTENEYLLTHLESKVITLYFVDLVNIFRNLTHLCTLGNRYALKFCELSINLRY